MMNKLWKQVQKIAYQFNLNRLADVHETDKGIGGHGYTNVYQLFFKKLKFRSLKLLEIGVGGDGPSEGGASLRMWKNYFPFAQIYGLDIQDKSFLEERRITIYQGNQADPDILERLTANTGDLDIIIDDGSHQNEHVIKSFELLFPYLKVGGLYFVEDAQTSYWPRYGGASDKLEDVPTMMNYFKRLVDRIHFPELILRNPIEPNIYDKHVVALHFYRSLIVIEKGDNSRPSTIVKNHQAPSKW